MLVEGASIIWLSFCAVPLKSSAIVVKVTANFAKANKLFDEITGRVARRGSELESAFVQFH